MAPLPFENIIENHSPSSLGINYLIPILSVGIPLLIVFSMLLIVLITTKSKKNCLQKLWCLNTQTETHTGDHIGHGHGSQGQCQRKKFVKESSPKITKNNHIGYPIDISTITRTLPTIPECLESYSFLNFGHGGHGGDQKFTKEHIFRTPSDVPRTAELIEMSSGPGKTVTDYTADRSSLRVPTVYLPLYIPQVNTLNKVEPFEHVEHSMRLYPECLQ